MKQDKESKRDNLMPDEDGGDCEFHGHIRSNGIPLDDDGKATCRECGALFDEYEDRQRVIDVQKQAEQDEAERRLGL